MITHHIHYAPFSERAIRERSPYVEGYEIRWTDSARHKYGSALAEYLDLLDDEDEATGDACDWHGFYRRFGKRILVTTTQGFVFVTRYDNEDEAIAEFTEIDREYSQDTSEDEDNEGDDLTHTTVADLRAHNANTLARLADCASPDSSISAGADFLRVVRDSLVDRLADSVRLDEDDASDLAHEIADSCVPIYTHDLWSAFVDLGAYNEDTSDYLGEGADLTSAANIALFQIGERLALALWSEYNEDTSA